MIAAALVLTVGMLFMFSELSPEPPPEQSGAASASAAESAEESAAESAQRTPTSVEEINGMRVFTYDDFPMYDVYAHLWLGMSYNEALQILGNANDYCPDKRHLFFNGIGTLHFVDERVLSFASHTSEKYWDIYDYVNLTLNRRFEDFDFTEAEYSITEVIEADINGFAVRVSALLEEYELDGEYYVKQISELKKTFEMVFDRIPGNDYILREMREVPWDDAHYSFIKDWNYHRAMNRLVGGFPATLDFELIGGSKIEVTNAAWVFENGKLFWHDSGPNTVTHFPGAEFQIGKAPDSAEQKLLIKYADGSVTEIGSEGSGRIAVTDDLLGIYCGNRPTRRLLRFDSRVRFFSPHQ
jgi:hypothetical protein